MGALTSLADALATVDRVLGGIMQVHAAASEDVPLDQALGRVLAWDILADRDQPAFDRSTRDGFAVRSAACAQVPCTLHVAGEIAAGASFDATIPDGACVEIMTGAPVPADADAVVMIENTQRPDAQVVVVNQSPRAGENIVPRGSEARAGDVVLAAGTAITPAVAGVLASVGVATPRVYARVRVAIVTTGDELVAVDEKPGPTQIRNSNLHALTARVQAAGALALALPIAADDPVRLRAVLQDAFTRTDLVLITGGVSKGKYDHVKDVLALMEAQVHFAGVAMRPGKPVVFGERAGPGGARCFFGLPGNPVSALVAFQLFVRPALSALQGRPPGTGAPRFLGAQLLRAHRQGPTHLHAFVPARLRAPAESGGLVGLEPLGGQGSGDVVTLAAADALLSVAPGVSDLAAGAPVVFLPLD